MNLGITAMSQTTTAVATTEEAQTTAETIAEMSVEINVCSSSKSISCLYLFQDNTFTYCSDKCRIFHYVRG